MSYLVPLHIIGGNGGDYFRFTGESTGATMKRLWVWVGGWQVKAMRIWLNDGRSQEFGRTGGTLYKFEFGDGERITSLSLWGNGAGSRLGAIKFRTNWGNEFFPYMTSWGLKTEYPMNIGSGICLGVVGRAGHDIDCAGFVFINDIQSAVLTKVTYPTLDQVDPQIGIEDIESVTYINDSDLPQNYTLETSKTIRKKSSWSVSNKYEKTFSIGVRASILKIVEVSSEFKYTTSEESNRSLENEETKTKKLTFPVQVPPRKTVDVNITIGRATVDLPYTGTLEITCYNGGVLRLNTSGIYRGIAYTKAKTTVTEK